MPLHKIINHNSATKIYIWKIEETFEDLFDEVILNDINLIRLNTMKSQMHQRGFLSVRKLLQEAGLSDLDLFYTPDGKPHLKNNQFISITHSHEFSAIIISDQHVGIDIELNREKIIRIADKFVDYEFNYLDSENTEEYIKKLTVIWGAKEAIFKIKNEEGISFKDHIKVNPFDLNKNNGRALLHFNNIIEDYILHFESIENYTLVYVFSN